jgi:Pyridoxal-phosphate dependent enzyme
MITLQKHNGITVLRDDLLEGGTKSRFLAQLMDPEARGYVYATPAFGGFQIALAATAKALGKKASIFVAKRKNRHPNTLKAKELGADITDVDYGYLTTVQSRARAHAAKYGFQYLEWGANYPKAIASIAEVMREITKELGEEPDEIWCTIGSGVLMRGILQGTDTALIQGVQVGKEYTTTHDRVRIHTYHKPFQDESKAFCPFPSSANYDRKAWEYALQKKTGKNVLFWNVLG